MLTLFFPHKKFGPIDGAMMLELKLHEDPSGDASLILLYDEIEHSLDVDFDAYSRSSSFGGGGKITRMSLLADLKQGELTSYSSTTNLSASPCNFILLRSRHFLSSVTSKRLYH